MSDCGASCAETFCHGVALRKCANNMLLNGGGVLSRVDIINASWRVVRKMGLFIYRAWPLCMPKAAGAAGDNHIDERILQKMVM